VYILPIQVQISKKGDGNFDQISQNLKESSKTKKPMDLELDPSFFHSLAPMDYYMYEGSLTRPPCAEKVLHLVVKEPRTIAENQLEELRKLTSQYGKEVCDNYRPIQPLNKRKVILVKERYAHLDEYDMGRNDWRGETYGEHYVNMDDQDFDDHSHGDRYGSGQQYGRRDYNYGHYEENDGYLMDYQPEDYNQNRY